MTNPALGNNFVKELIVSGLKPEFIVTESPYYIKDNNSLSYPFKKLLKFLKFIKNKGELERKYQPYFLAKKYGIPIISSDIANSRFMEKKLRKLT